MPCLLLAVLVLEVEGDDGLGLFDGVLALGGVGLEGGVDHVEGGGGGESVCVLLVSIFALYFLHQRQWRCVVLGWLVGWLRG